ncbi:calcium-binding protein [Brevundimonas sp.]|uniref:calcium-binding protein n=1 Tax=Brevundimonas sp. TaxID=1871086 RepID=UPI002D66A056|nr:calcium-binding protein [Brevundimonas sp.]HYC99276.1 calcium-binding protein [Brevundimonas sp.]
MPIRYTVDLNSNGYNGQYSFVIDLGAGSYDEVRFNSYAASSQPLTIVVDGRQNLNAFRVAFYGVVQTGSLTVYGHAGNDIMTGGIAGPNIFYGGLGDDIYAGTGAVEVAGEGTDTLYSQQFDVTLPEHVERLIHGYVEFFGSGLSHALREQYSPAAIGRGNAQDNYISGFGVQYGMGGDDVLAGGTLVDTLIGGAGNDTLNGGANFDTASYIDAASGVFVTLDQAQPMATDDGDGGVDTLNGIENITGSAFNDVLIGDAGANALTGGTGADVLIGLAGNDRLVGGTGAANQMQGGLGDDLYVVSVLSDTVYELAGEGQDTVETALAAYTLRENLEGLRFTGAGAFTGTGNAGANSLFGGAGVDTLNAAAGDDSLFGAVGNDVLRGGAGNDRLDGGGQADTADYAAVGAGVTVSIANGRASNDGEGGQDILVDIENILGSAFNDVLLGGGANNVLDGGAGADVLVGMAGDDRLIGGSGAANQMQGGLGNDRYVVSVAGDTLIENAGEGVDFVETALSAYTLRANFEELIYTGSGAFSGVGNALNNVLRGGAGNDTFSGRGGDDGINGGAGVDTVVMSGVRADYTIQAGNGYVTIGDSVVGRDGIDTLFNIERIRFSDGTELDITPPPPAPAASLAEPGPEPASVLNGARWDGDLPPALVDPWSPWNDV